MHWLVFADDLRILHSRLGDRYGKRSTLTFFSPRCYHLSFVSVSPSFLTSRHGFVMHVSMSVFFRFCFGCSVKIVGQFWHFGKIMRVWAGYFLGVPLSRWFVVEAVVFAWIAVWFVNCMFVTFVFNVGLIFTFRISVFSHTLACCVQLFLLVQLFSSVTCFLVWSVMVSLIVFGSSSVPVGFVFDG